MPRFAANISTMFTDRPFAERIQAAAAAGFQAIECQFPYEVAASELRQRLADAGVELILLNTPPGDFDATYWWPKSAGYDRAIVRMTYTPIETWELLAAALQRTGMTADETALVVGGNMMRVARQVWR